MAEHEKIQILPLVPLKNSVLFPGLLMPLSIGRPASLAAVEAALSTEEKEVVVVAQRTSTVDSPAMEDIFTIGTRAVIRKMSRPSEDLLEVLVLGVERVVVLKLDATEPFVRARISSWPLPEEKNAEVEALTRALLELARRPSASPSSSRRSRIRSSSASCSASPTIPCAWSSCWLRCSAWMSRRSRRCSKPAPEPTHCGHARLPVA